MKELMASFLFDRPFSLNDASNRCNLLLTGELATLRSDAAILSRVAKLRNDFLTQEDCLCHGDFSTDNILVKEKEFKVYI